MGEVRIVGPGKRRGYPYPVCKKPFSHIFLAKNGGIFTNNIIENLTCH